MRLQFQEKNRSENEYDYCHAPESDGNFPTLPEPYLVDKAVAVSLDQIKHGIDLEENMVLFRDYLY